MHWNSFFGQELPVFDVCVWVSVMLDLDEQSISSSPLGQSDEIGHLSFCFSTNCKGRDHGFKKHLYVMSQFNMDFNPFQSYSIHKYLSLHHRPMQLKRISWTNVGLNNMVLICLSLFLSYIFTLFWNFTS